MIGTSSSLGGLLNGNPLLLAKAQFNEALMTDDGLFVEEEQNLYIDKVGEVTRWSDLFLDLPLWEQLKLRLPGLHEGSLLLEFAGWVKAAVLELNRTLAISLNCPQVQQRWSHTPAGFTAAFRTLRCANVFLKCHTKHFRKYGSPESPEEQKMLQELEENLEGLVEEILSALRLFRPNAIKQNVHVVLLRELEGQKLLDPTPEPFLSRTTLQFKHGLNYGQPEKQPPSRPDDII